MSTCERLFHANNIYAYYVTAEKHVVIVADVVANPVADEVHICPNPIAIPPSREFIISGTTKPGIHPMLVTVRRMSTSFASDLTPKSVIVYSAGVDAPLRQEVMLSAAPPAPLTELAVHTTQGEQPSPEPVEVTGYSPTFSLEQAVQDALAQAAAERPVPPLRNPDLGVEIDIKDIFARTGGNTRPGLFVRATAR